MDAVHRMLTTASKSTSTYYQPEGGVLSGLGYLDDTLCIFMVQVVVIIAMTRALSMFSKVLKQPRVIMEVVGGILLGPSALGRIPHYLDRVFPKSSLGYLALVANLALVLYLFLVGVELDPNALKRNGKKAVLIATIGIAFPFGLGAAISPLLFDKLLIVSKGYENASFTSFIVFVGVSLSITAFPVLARILTESKLILSGAGVMTMGAAALNDAIAWCLLVLALSILHSGNSLTALWVFLSISAYALFLFCAVRPALARLIAGVETNGSASMESFAFAMIICLMFLSAWTTALLGVHSIFGSFLLGMIMPRKSHFTLRVTERIEDLASNVFLPLYFALSGLKTDISSISGATSGGLLVLVIAAATVGKFIGCAGTAKVCGIPWRESAVIGILMNTRGLVELIVLNIGLQARVLNVELFTIMVMMALVTTFMTSPVVEYIYPPHLRTMASAHAVDATAAHTEPKDHLELVVIDEASDEDGPDTATGLPERTKSIMEKALVRVGLIIDSAHDIEEALCVLHLFAPGYHSTKKVEIVALHFKESDISSVDVQHAVNPDAYSVTHPTLSHISHFCHAIGLGASCYSVVGNASKFPSDLIALNQHHHLDLVLLLWRESDWLMDYHANFVQDAITGLKSPLALVVRSPQHEPTVIRQVLVVLTGHESDDGTSLLARRFSSSGLLRVVVVLLPSAKQPDVNTWRRTRHSSNVDLVRMTESDGAGEPSLRDQLMHEASKPIYDLVVCAYTSDTTVFGEAPDSPHLATIQSEDTMSSLQQTQRPRMRTLTEAFQRKLTMVSPVPLVDHTEQFGVVGGYLYTKQLNATLMIIRSPGHTVAPDVNEEP